MPASKTPVPQKVDLDDLDPDDLTIIGMAELSVLLGVGRRTPHAWYFRRVLPEPDYPSINGLRAWERSTVIDWAATSGRLPQDGSLHKEVSPGVEIKERHGGAQVKPKPARKAKKARK